MLWFCLRHSKCLRESYCNLIYDRCQSESSDTDFFSQAPAKIVTEYKHCGYFARYTASKPAETVTSAHVPATTTPPAAAAATTKRTSGSTVSVASEVVFPLAFVFD